MRRSMTRPSGGARICRLHGAGRLALCVMLAAAGAVSGVKADFPSSRPPLADLEPEEGTVCFGCIKKTYRFRANLDWDGTGDDRADLDLHTIRLIPDPNMTRVYYGNRPKFLPRADPHAAVFGWLDCDDLGTSRSNDCSDRRGEDFRLKTSPLVEDALRYCFAVVQFRGALGARRAQPFTLRVSVDDNTHEHRGEVGATTRNERSRVEEALRRECERGVLRSGDKLVDVEAVFFALDLGPDTTPVMVDHNLP